MATPSAPFITLSPLYLQIDTANILFICGGAFSGLEDIVQRRVARASIGFGAKLRVDFGESDRGEEAQVGSRVCISMCMCA